MPTLQSTDWFAVYELGDRPTATQSAGASDTCQRLREDTMSDRWRCEHCGSVIKRPPRWAPDPQRDVTVTEAAKTLGLSRERVYQLIEDRWLTVSGTAYSPRRKRAATTRAGIMYVTRESVADCAENWRPNKTSRDERIKILQTLSDIGVIGELRWKTRYGFGGGRTRWVKTL